MRATGWTTGFTVCMLTGLARGGAAQQVDSAPARSTRTGVYAARQAARGQDIYALMCQTCHTPDTHTGAAFWNNWSGRELWELVRYIKESMPKGDPGSLTTQETTLLLAYLLKLNGMPAGPDELPADSVALKAIRFARDQPWRDD